jgi:hypothetical protein
MPLITSSDSLKNLIESGRLSIVRKPQKAIGSFNYFFTPTLSLTLYNPKVMLSNNKFIVLEFDRYRQLSLFTMLKSVHNQLTCYLKRSYVVDCDNCYGIASENESTFTVRCSLPQSGGRYRIQCETNGVESKFQVPRSGLSLEKVNVEIRNVWYSDSRLGYNLEVKGVSE